MEHLPKPKRLCSNSKDKKINRLFIPEDVVGEILLRLPAESLIICKRVCKSWCNLINDPFFVNKHLLRVTNEHRKKSSSYRRSFVLKWIRQELSLEFIFANPRIRTNTFWYGKDPSEHELSLVTVCEDEDDDHGNSDYLPCVVEQVSIPPFPEVNDQVRFPTHPTAFHCNGIIHMFDHFREEVAVLLNPVLREFKLLQTPYPPLEYSRGTDGYRFAGSGFGYDPKANVYKYVKVFRNRSSVINPIALVYTMGSRSSWRVVKIDVGDNYFWLYRTGVYCKGAYFWWNDNSLGATILSFDMSTEKFRSVPLPDQLCRGMAQKNKELTVWKESVCFFFCLKSSWFSSTFEMWLMVDNCGGVAGSTGWTKHLTIGPLVCITVPLAFWKDDELLMEGYDGRVVSYNIYTQKLRRVPLHGAVLPGSTSANLCLNSVVSV